MEAIQKLQDQLSDALTKLEIANLEVAQLIADQKALKKAKARAWEEVAQLDEALAQSADHHESDVKALAAQEEALAQAEAQLHLLQLQMGAVPGAFVTLSRGFVDSSVLAAAAAAAMLADAKHHDFWREQIATNVATIALLKQNHKTMLTHNKRQKERELQSLQAQVEEEEQSLAMIEACLAAYEKKLLELPPRPVVPSVTPVHHQQQHQQQQQQQQQHQRQQQPASIYFAQQQPSQPHPPQRSHGPTSQPHQPYPSLMPPQRQSPAAQPPHQPPQLHQQRVTQHTHTVTRVTEEVEVEVVDAHPRAHGLGTGMGLGLAYHPPPAAQPYPQQYQPQPQHHSQQQQLLYQHPPYPQQPRPYAAHEADAAASDVPWYQQHTKRHRSVQQTVSTTEQAVGPFAAPSAGAGAGAAGRADASSSSSSSRQSHVNAPHFKSGLDLLMETEEGR